MIPVSTAFIRRNYGIVRASAIQATPAAANVNAVAYRAQLNRTTEAGTQLWYIWEVTLAVMTANMWTKGMSVALAGTTFPAGSYEIETVTATGLRIYTKEPRGALAQTTAAGTATPTGITPTVNDVYGTAVLNNMNEEVAETYTGTQYFLINLTNKGSVESIIQVINNHSSVGITVTIEESVNGVNFSALPTAISADAIAAGVAKTYHFKEYFDKWLKITVTATNSLYQVIMR